MNKFIFSLALVIFMAFTFGVESEVYGSQITMYYKKIPPVKFYGGMKPNGRFEKVSDYLYLENGHAFALGVAEKKRVSRWVKGDAISLVSMGEGFIYKMFNLRTRESITLRWAGKPFSW